MEHGPTSAKQQTLVGLCGLGGGDDLEVEVSEISRAYSRGFYRGSHGAWPDHRPLAPPHHVIGPLVEAAKALRDGADHICATLMDDDEFVQELSPLIDALDEAMTKYADWLREVEE